MIDAHRHFWRYNGDEFGWIDDDRLRADFLPAQFAGERVVAVEARQLEEETRWLLALAKEHPFIAGVVGWLPIASPDFPRALERYLGDPKLVALRHVIQDEPDDAFILREDFNRGIDLIGRTRLKYDILVFARHLANTIAFVDRHPGQAFVLDHCGKPRIGAEFDAAWAADVRALARRENVTCKLSGLVTEIRGFAPAPGADALAPLAPYVDCVLEAFGPARVMFGSDWPVLTARTDFAAWAAFVAARLSAGEREQVFDRTAAEFYGV